jgi:hypothetical protein
LGTGALRAKLDHVETYVDLPAHGRFLAEAHQPAAYLLITVKHEDPEPCLSG